MEERILASEARYRFLAEHALDVISLQDLSGAYLYVSPASWTMLGYRPEEMTGVSAEAFLHPDDIDRITSYNVCYTKLLRELFLAVGRPNVLIKIPATVEGLPAIEETISRGIPVNVTLIFSGKRYEEVAQAYIRGVERLAVAGKDPRAVTSVASFS